MKTGDLTQKKVPRRRRDGSQAVGCAPGEGGRPDRSRPDAPREVSSRRSQERF